MKKRVMAWLLVILMVLQMLPIEVLAEGWNTAVSNEARGAEYVNAKFQYPVYGEDADGAEIIIDYETIVMQMVEKGKTAVVPNIPDVAGHAFIGWINEKDGTSLDTSKPLTEDTVFTADYRKLGIHTVTIHYVFDSDGSMAQEPYVAEFKTGSKVELAVESPKMSGFEVAQEDEVFKINIDSIEKDEEFEVRYTGKQTYYTVKYFFQNAEDNNYTEGYFYRDVIPGSEVQAGRIDVGPYEISTYPEGTSHAGEPVIAGGMTEVRDFEIEGFVQQKITQRRVMPGGTTVVNVYYDRDVYMYTIDNDGGTAVDSQALRYGASLGLPDASEMERPGYTFDGFYSKAYVEQDGKWVETDGEQEHDSSCKMPPYDFTIEVRWKPLEEADYKVVYWVQSVKDAYDTADDAKTYDFLSSETFHGKTGTTPTIRNLSPQNHGLSSTFYALSHQRSEIREIQGTGNNRYATAKKTIASDGSTVINVYFDRQTVTYNFYNSDNTKREPWLVLKGLYGQTFAEASKATGVQIAWPAVPTRGYMWKRGNTAITYLSGFYASDMTATTVNFTRTKAGNAVVRQYTENLDGSWNLADDFQDSTGNLNVIDKFAPAFRVTGYDTKQNNVVGPTGNVSAGGSVDGDYIEIYNTRNSFNLEYANCAENSMKDAKSSYKYEEILEEPIVVPQRPESVESDYEFVGWYLDKGFQIPVDWGTYTMPAANLVVYAKWAPPTYTVTYHDIRTNTVDEEFTDTTTRFEVEKFGTLVSREDVANFNKKYIVGGTTYIDNTDKLTYTFMGWYLDESYTVAWDYGIDITGDRDVYAKWEPSGQVYYRYVFQGMNPDGTSEELGKWPEVAFDAKVWPNLPYGTFAEASVDFGKAGRTDFPEFEGWRPMSTLSTMREQLTEQYQEIPVYYVPTTTWPLTIHYVDEKGTAIANPEMHDLTEAIKVYEYKRIDGYKLKGDPQLTASKNMDKEDDGRVHITFTYEKIKPLSYRVEYYLQNLNGTYELNGTATKTYSSAESGKLLGETATLVPDDYKTFTGYVRNQNHADTVERVILQSEEDQNVLRLYYDLQTYTVTYRYINEKPDGAPDVYPQEFYKYGETVTVKPLPRADGYTFRGWFYLGDVTVSGTFTMPATNVILQGNWAAENDTEYQIHFYRMQEDGTYPTDPHKIYRAGITDTEASVTDDDKADKTIDGLHYTLDEDQENVFSGTIAGDGSLVLKLYFKQVKANYTVYHYLKDTKIKVAEEQTFEAQVGSKVTASEAEDRNQGFENARVVSAVPQDAAITVTENEAQNVITLYYEMPLTLQANSASKTYDGKPLTEGGFKVVNPENLVDGIKEADITLRMTKNSAITNPGSAANTIDGNSILFKGVAVPSYYNLTLQPGTLEVLSRLNVTKTVTKPVPSLEGESGLALGTPAFQFTLTKDGQPVAGAGYSVNNQQRITAEDGSFCLNAGETAVFNDLTVGTYTVQESYSGDWLPAEGGYTQTAVIANSGVGDVKVGFTNRRNVLESITLQKKWVDGEGSAAERPEELTMTLKGTIDGNEVYTAPVTLTAKENWTKTVTGLPAMADGKAITYALTENTVPDGYEASYSSDGRIVTNTVNQSYLTIQGTKTWVDGGKHHNNAEELTITLERKSSKEGSKWEAVSKGYRFGWTEDKPDQYGFTDLERYDDEGYRYIYRVRETINNPEEAALYETAYSPVNGETVLGGVWQVDITNTLRDPEDVSVSGTKTWVDGGREHNNAEEVMLSLFRISAKPEAEEEPVEGAVPEWDGATYKFSGLDRYDNEGYTYTYTVREAPIEGYTSESNGNNFTNTLSDPMDVSVSGTKTWVDGGREHNNAEEVTLSLFRTSAKPEAGEEPVEGAVPEWNGATYKFSGLDRYDNEGYTYTYTVREAPIEGYTSESNGNDFTNTITQEMLTIQGTKTWTDGNEKHTIDQVALTLQRQVNGEEWENVTVEPQWSNWTYTYTDLPKYNNEGYTYTYKVVETEKPDGYVISYTPVGGVAEFEGTVANVDIINTAQTREVTVTKQWLDTFEEVPNYWNLRPNNVVVTLTGMVNGEPAEGLSYNVTVKEDSWSAAQNVRTHDAKGNPVTYAVSEENVEHYNFMASESTKEITPVKGEKEVQVTNSLQLLDGDGQLIVTKRWDDKGGSQSDRPEVSFQLLYADGNPVTANGQKLFAELGEDNTAIFENVPVNVNGYIVEEIVDSETNKGQYVCEQPDNQVRLEAGETIAVFTNTRTMAVVTVTKKIVDETTDKTSGLSQKFTFSVDGGEAKSTAVGNGESVIFEVEIGKEYSLSEYAQDGSELPKNVWSTEGLGSFTATEAAHTISVTNTRKMKNDNGIITVNKIWANGDGETLNEELIPAGIDVQLYEGEDADILVEASRTLNNENGWQTIYRNLPVAAVDGVEKFYSVKELMDGTACGDGDSLMIGELKFTAKIAETNDGFEIINTLEDRKPEDPEKVADNQSQKDVQVGDLVTYTIRRTSHLSTTANAIVTDTMPNELAYVGTDSMKVNGQEVSYEISQEANKITWYVNDIPPMGEVECVLTAQVTGKAMGTIDNVATVGLVDDDGEIDFGEAESTIKVARFRLDKEAKLPDGKVVAAVGDTIHYTITVTGTGAAVLTDLTVEDAMFARADEGSIFRNGKKVPADQVENNVITLHMPLREGITQTIEYDVTVTEDDILLGMVNNLATGRAKDPAGENEPDLVAADDTHTPTEKKNGHLTVVKTTDSEPANGTDYALGETISYKIRVINDGTLTIRNIEVTDSLSDAEGQVIGTIESLAPGESKDFAFEYVVTEADILNGSVK
ncbi:MAG: Cna B-type domain-containing protein, partial [Marvinbryantia sp.]